GGDEFAVLFPQTDAAQAHAIAERLRIQIASSALDRGGAAGGGPARGTGSGGPGGLPGGRAALPRILTLARSGLYRAKNAGRDRVAVLTESGQAVPASEKD